MAMATVSLLGSLGLAGGLAYTTYTWAEPADLPADQRVVAYFANAEWWCVCAFTATIGLNDSCLGASANYAITSLRLSTPRIINSPY